MEEALKFTLTDRVANNAAQVWSMDATTSAIKQSGQCLDLNSGNLVNNRQIAIRYSCSGNNNQQMDNAESKYKLDFGWGNLKKHGYFSEKLESSIFELNHCSSGK